MEYQQVHFTWPYTEPNDVIVTGTFDQWRRSIHLNKSSSGFTAIVDVPYDQKIDYKFIVDGKWMVCPTEPTTYDKQGNQNNYFFSASKPASTIATPTVTIAPQFPPSSEARSDAPSGVLPSDVPEKVEQAAETVTDTAQSLSKTAVDTSAQVLDAGKDKDDSKNPTETPTLERVVKTFKATDGVTSPTQYVASGLGVVIQAVTGVDPINREKIAVDDTDITHEVHNEGLTGDTPNAEADGPTVKELVEDSSKPDEIIPVVPVAEEPVIPSPTASELQTETEQSQPIVPVLPVVAPESTPEAVVVDTLKTDTPQVNPEVAPEPVVVPHTLSPVSEIPGAITMPTETKPQTAPEPKADDASSPTTHTTEGSAATTTTVADSTPAPTASRTKAASHDGIEREKDPKTISPPSSPRRSLTWSRKSKKSFDGSPDSSPSKHNDNDGTKPHHKKRESFIKKLKHLLD